MSKFAFIYRGNTKGGTKLVIEKLLEEFDKNDKNQWTLITDKKECINNYKNIKVKYIRNIGGLLGYFLWDYLQSFFSLLDENFDAVLYPKGSIPIDHILLKSKKAYIVHDLGYFVEEFNAYPAMDTFFMKRQMKFSCKVADIIFAISEFTKEDIVNRFKIDREKIVVTYEGILDVFKKSKNREIIEDCMKRNKIKRPYLFYSGSISPRKNLLRVLQALNNLKKEIPHTLVMTGRASWGDTGLDEFIKENDLQERVNVVGFVSYEDVAILTSEADMYLFPSLYEGFGLPILEAQSCGCPVLTSNVSSCPEIAGKAAIVVDPYSVEEIANGILIGVRDDVKRKRLIALGYENIKKYSWLKMSQTVLTNIKKLT